MGRHMGRWTKELKVSRLFWHSLAVGDAENGQPKGQPKKSTRLAIAKGWKELWLTRQLIVTNDFSQCCVPAVY